MTDQDQSAGLQAALGEARAAGTPMRITGGNSKAFYGRPVEGNALDTTGHRGIVSYTPTELVLTARAGTPLSDIETELRQHGQYLPFEPPRFGASATLGGAIACGLAGPRRPWCGAVRDHLLGCRILTGQGDILHFGGEVMKNVAGYDITRLMCGALGTLGVVLEVSLKVLPLPAAETTRRFEMVAGTAIDTMNHWAGQPLPLSGACHDGKHLYVRLSGAARAVAAAAGKLGGEPVGDGAAFWTGVREQTHAFFDDPRPLWRLSLPPACPVLDLPGDTLLDWGGAQRWLLSEIESDRLREIVAAAGGHATRFRRHGTRDDVFQPLPGPLLELHRRLKQRFDPDRLLNPGRLYPEL